MMQSAIPSVQVKTEQLFSEAKGKCHNILARHKNTEDQEALISSDESEDDIIPKTDCSRSFTSGQDNMRLAETMSESNIEQASVQPSISISEVKPDLLESRDDELQDIIQKEGDEGLLAIFD